MRLSKPAEHFLLCWRSSAPWRFTPFFEQKIDMATGEERLERLIRAYGEVLTEHELTRELFGVI